VSTPHPEVEVGQLPADATLLDVREQDEWDAGHAPGAVHIPLPELAERLGEVPDGEPLYVVCRSGGRSARATQFLNVQGWDAVNVQGGMTAWAATGRPVEGSGPGPARIL
jgi:rhodanese-related sulfurtransferase